MNPQENVGNVYLLKGGSYTAKQGFEYTILTYVPAFNFGSAKGVQEGYEVRLNVNPAAKMVHPCAEFLNNYELKPAAPVAAQPTEQ